MELVSVIQWGSTLSHFGHTDLFQFTVGFVNNKKKCRLSPYLTKNGDFLCFFFFIIFNKSHAQSQTNNGLIYLVLCVYVCVSKTWYAAELCRLKLAPKSKNSVKYSQSVFSHSSCSSSSQPESLLQSLNFCYISISSMGVWIRLDTALVMRGLAYSYEI